MSRVAVGSVLRRGLYSVVRPSSQVSSRTVASAHLYQSYSTVASASTSPCPRALPSLISKQSFCSSTAARATTDPDQVKPAPPTGQSIVLDYEVYQPPADSSPKAGSAKAIVVCHGLFGSKQNWRSLAKAMAKEFAVPIYAVDLRNHGTSPHTQDGMSYSDMALDLLQFVTDHKLEKICLVGHSMGGKAVQAFALSPDLPEGVLEYLVSVDMSPAKGPLSKEFEQYIESMIEIEDVQVTSRAQADEMLQKVEGDLGIRQFLLTNLHRPSGQDHWTFRIPVKTIKKYLSQIGDFPYDPPSSTEAGARSWQGKTYFIKGAKSKYLNRKNKPVCDALFPNAVHVTLDAGHWVQAEKPKEFISTLGIFFDEQARAAEEGK